MSDRRSRSDQARASMSRFGMMGFVPPPPAGMSLSSRQMIPERGEHDEPQAPDEDSASRGPVFPFDAELEMAEVDDRGKLGASWSARSRMLSRSMVTITSRRMCHTERRVLIAIHRVDDEPMMLLGRVSDCEYESDGLYLLEVELLPMNDVQPSESFSRRAGA